MSTSLSRPLNGQQSILPGEQPTSGNSLTIPELSVAIAKMGTVQLPVNNGLVPQVAVTVGAFE